VPRSIRASDFGRYYGTARSSVAVAEKGELKYEAV
jgi:hypothetical protein